jgi:hypothetical protein
MSATVKLSSALPGDEEINGLDALVRELVEEPHRIRVALVWLDVPKILTDTEKDTEVPVVRIRRIEPLGDVATIPEEVRRLATTAHENRTGRTPLPFEDVDLAHDETLDE